MKPTKQVSSSTYQSMGPKSIKKTNFSRKFRIYIRIGKITNGRKINILWWKRIDGNKHARTHQLFRGFKNNIAFDRSRRFGSPAALARCHPFDDLTQLQASWPITPSLHVRILKQNNISISTLPNINQFFIFLLYFTNIM